MILDNNGNPVTSQQRIKVLTPEAFQACFEILDFHNEVLEQMANGTPIQNLAVISAWFIALIEAQDPSWIEKVDVMRSSMRDYGAAYMEKHGMIKDPAKGQFTLFFPVLSKKDLTLKEN